MEHEIDEMYDTYEREYGIYFTDEIDLTHCFHQLEIFLSAGCDPEEALNAVKQEIIGAADEAQRLMNEGEY